MVARVETPLSSLFPEKFQPNRRESAPQHGAFAQVAPGESMSAISAWIQGAVTANLDALFARQAPRPVPLAPLPDLFRPPEQPDPLAGFGLEQWQKAHLPEADLTLRLMRDPGLAMALASTRTQIGAAVLFPLLLDHALCDAAFRHDIAERCRLFLCDKVLFHPGPPPVARFSAGGLALLFTSQDAHGAELGKDFATIRQAAETLSSPSRPYGPWDQWLLRRMAESAGWTVPAALADLPWVAWHGASDMPDMVDPRHPVPAYWPRILDLLP